MIRTFYISSNNLEKWLHQNNGTYTGDFVEGCLLDNFIVETKRGYAAFYEHCTNEWSSVYRVEFQAFKETRCNELFDRWNKFVEKIA